MLATPNAKCMSAKDIYADPNIIVDSKTIDLYQDCLEQADLFHKEDISSEGIFVLLPAFAYGCTSRYSKTYLTEYEDRCEAGLHSRSYRYYNAGTGLTDLPLSQRHTGDYFTEVVGGTIIRSDILGYNVNYPTRPYNYAKDYDRRVSIVTRRVFTPTVVSNYHSNPELTRCPNCYEYYFTYRSVDIWQSSLESITVKELSSMSFTDCDFTSGLFEATSYLPKDETKWKPLLHGVPTVFSNCTFTGRVWLQATRTGNITFNNCTVLGDQSLILESCSGTLDLSQWSGNSSIEILMDV